MTNDSLNPRAGFARMKFAWQYGQQAKKDGKDRVVPADWADTAAQWLAGYDGETVEEAYRK